MDLTFWSSNSRVPLPGLFLLLVFVYSCRSWLKLPTPLLSYVVLVWSMHGSKSSEGVGCAAVFPDYDVFISHPVAASVFTVELCVIFLALSRILFHDSNNFVIYLDSRNALQAL